MKKFQNVLKLAVLLAAVVGLIACGGKNKNTGSTGGTAAPAAAVNPVKGKTIAINIPHRAGSSTDIVARTFQTYFSREVEATVIIENLEGGGGNRSHNTTFKAKPDGTTLEITPFPSAVLGELTKGGEFKSLEYTYINTITGADYNGIFVPYNSPYQTINDLVSAAKAKELTCAGSGIGTNGHMALILLEKAAGIKFEYVSFDGGSEAAVAVAGNHTDCGVGNVVALKQLSDEKRIRVIAVVGADRHPAFPDAPTAKEMGYPNAVMDVCVGLIAPPGMDAETVKFLAAAGERVCKNPEFIAQSESLGSSVVYLGPADFKNLAGNIYKQAIIVAPDIQALSK
ncbi:tripartite tricarboxylate transporter substrate binding protein [Treponema primitia]|uniref:tripartite tricarboxylate transporter substrate binding protein n=1 Tax=Treponema primitia TaxID=88058 RepID=UPI00397FD95C